jgi:hypothetical protein
MIHPDNLKSATQIFKDMLKKGWKVFSQTRQGKTFKVVLKKSVLINRQTLEDIKTIFVGWWALPKTLKVEKIPRQGSNRKGTPKPARMSYA